MANLMTPGDANRNWWYHASQARTTPYAAAGEQPRGGAVSPAGPVAQPGGYGGYSGGGGVADLSASYQQAQDAANAANEARYQQILGGHDQRISNANAVLDQGYQQETDDTNRRYQDLTAAREQDLVSRGLSGSTIRGTMQQGMERERSQALNRLNESHRREQLGYQTSLSGDRLGFMERRTDAGPDYNQLIGLQQGLGQAGYGQGGYGGYSGAGGMGVGLGAFAQAVNGGGLGLFGGYSGFSHGNQYGTSNNGAYGGGQYLGGRRNDPVANDPLLNTPVQGYGGGGSYGGGDFPGPVGKPYGSNEVPLRQSSYQAPGLNMDYGHWSDTSGTRPVPSAYLSINPPVRTMY